jgi:Lrp/AsnC family transcriptional regulator for asnA, asnC and gidA
VGFEAPAMIGVTVQPAMLESVAETIASFPEVSYLIMVSGEFDLFVEVFCRDRDDLAAFLNQKLHQVNGVVRTQTFMTLKIFKMAYGAQPLIK